MMRLFKNNSLRDDADFIIRSAIGDALPDHAVKEALKTLDWPGRITLVAAGKAAWRMASAAHRVLGRRIARGIVITKYDHS